ncbi:MAG: enolase C-terminal domain-like protein [Vulcanisaeta sp.]
MKITDIQVLRRSYMHESPPWPYTKPTDYYPEFRETTPMVAANVAYNSFLKIATDSGIYSIIEVSDDVADIVVKLKKYIINKEVDETELIFDQLFRVTLPYGRKGLVMMAISTIDLLLWDLKGKELNKPVYKLLGGPTREEVPAYASHLHPTDLKELEKEALEYVEEGYTAMKMRLCCGPADGPKGMEKNEELVKIVRNAVGYNVELMVDVWMAWNLKYAVKMLRRLEKYEIDWIEEPLPPDEIEGYKLLTKMVEVPVAAGEHAYGVWDFKALLDSGVYILQPDAMWSGGITTLKKVQALAEAYGASVIPHTSIPYNLHFLFSCPAHICPMAEFLTKYRWMEDFMVNPPRPQKGKFILSDFKAPGFGVKYDEDAIVKSR